MSRHFDNWLSTYINVTADQESPENFWFWSGVSILASTMGRSVVLDLNPGQKFQFFRIFPNHYIFLVAKSAVCRKGPPTNMVRTMLSLAGTAQIMGQRLTNASLITALANTAAKIGRGEMLAWASELSVFLSMEDARREITTTLTDLYDCPPEFKSELKTSATEIIPFPCLNLFAATNPTSLAERFPESAMGTGFTSRIHMIYEDTRRKKVSRPAIDDTSAQKLIEDLQHIKKLNGAFHFSPEAEKWYDKWYYSIEFPGDDSLDSFYGRKHIHLLKLAMIISIAQRDTLDIIPTDLMSALVFIEKMEANLPRAYRAAASSDFSRDMDRILNQLKKRGGSASKKDLLHDNWYCLKAEGLNAILAQLLELGSIEDLVDGRKTIYRICEAIPKLGEDS